MNEYGQSKFKKLFPDCPSQWVYHLHFYQWCWKVPFPHPFLTLCTILKILLSEILHLLMECSDYYWGRTAFLYFLVIFITSFYSLTILSCLFFFFISPIEDIYEFLILILYSMSQLHPPSLSFVFCFWYHKLLMKSWSFEIRSSLLNNQSFPLCFCILCFL